MLRPSSKYGFGTYTDPSSIVSIAAASQIGSHFGPAQIAWIERVQKRVAVTANMLNDIKAVKMLGLSDALYNITSKLRTDELKASEKFRKLLVLQILTGMSCNE